MGLGPWQYRLKDLFEFTQGLGARESWLRDPGLAASVGGGEKVYHFGGQKAPVEWLRLGYMRRRRRAAMVTQDGLSSAGLTYGAR